MTVFPLAADSRKRVDQAMHAQRLLPADRRFALVVDRIQEIGDHRAVLIVREGHRIGAGAALVRIARDLDHAAVMEADFQFRSENEGGAFFADDFDALAKARIGRGRRGNDAERAVFVFHRRGHEILGLHAMHRRGGRIGEDFVHIAGEREHQIERVDALRDQDAAAVARLGAAAGLVVIGLRTPVRHHRRAADHLAEIAAFEDLAQLQARRAETMLQTPRRR